MPFRLATLLKKTPTQLFPCEYCEILKNSFFYASKQCGKNKGVGGKKEVHSLLREFQDLDPFQLTCTCSQAAIETLKKGVNMLTIMYKVNSNMFEVIIRPERRQ